MLIVDACVCYTHTYVVSLNLSDYKCTCRSLKNLRKKRISQSPKAHDYYKGSTVPSLFYIFIALSKALVLFWGYFQHFLFLRTALLSQSSFLQSCVSEIALPTPCLPICCFHYFQNLLVRIFTPTLFLLELLCKIL